MLFCPVERERQRLQLFQSPADIEGGNSYSLCSSLLGTPLAGISGS